MSKTDKSKLKHLTITWLNSKFGSKMEDGVDVVANNDHHHDCRFWVHCMRAALADSRATLGPRLPASSLLAMLSISFSWNDLPCVLQ